VTPAFGNEAEATRGEGERRGADRFELDGRRAGTSLIFAKNRPYAAGFSAGSSATSPTRAGPSIWLGRIPFVGATVGGSVCIRTVTAAATVCGVTIAGTTTFRNIRALTDSGGAVTMDDLVGREAASLLLEQDDS
jgi:hypothetical protein